MKFYLSTTADLKFTYEDPSDTGPSAALAKAAGLGLELAEFCIVQNLGGNFENTDRLVMKKLDLAGEALIHAPFNELCPAAVDPLIRKVAEKRYLHTFRLAERYGAGKIVVHSGFDPLLYRSEWFVPQSVGFWRRLLEKLPEGTGLVLENVMESSPEVPLEICKGVDDKRFGLCLDIGHANLTPVPAEEWIEAYGSMLSHMHIHNNMGPSNGEFPAAGDLHDAPENGTMDVERILKKALGVAENLTATMETVKINEAVEWLIKRSLI